MKHSDGFARVLFASRCKYGRSTGSEVLFLSLEEKGVYGKTGVYLPT